MDQTQYIEQIIKNDCEWQKNTLVSALISCLPPDKACEFLDLKFFQEFDIRRIILRKIGKDIETDIQPCHNQLVEQMIKTFDSLPYKKKNSCGYCLSYLYHYFPEETQSVILNFLIKSKYVGMRRRAYKVLKHNWSDTHQSTVKNSWQQHKDLECALLIVQSFPLAYIQKQFLELERVIIQAPPWHVAKLFLRIATVDSSKLKRLAELDEITYAYVSAKSKQPFTERQALHIFENNKLDDRIGLLLWCFGQMGLWSVLVKISNQAEILEKEKLTEILSRNYQIEEKASF